MEQLFPISWALRWQDLFDIALNSYIIFRLYVLFRGTYVFRVLVGLAFLWFLQRISVSIGLIVTSWAVQGITAVAAIIIIVVFRDEIRSVLQARNWKSILWGFSLRGGETPVKTIVDAIYDLAGVRTGALLVFPGKEDLKESLHSGTRWQGLVSREMIMSIFWPGNPVHDGAAIIEEGRVTEVGVLLPLSKRMDLPSHYGTRHRAAAGLAEATDALVVVVSEERGTISVAQGSSMRPIHRREDLTRLLEEHLGFAGSQPVRRKREKLELGAAALVSVFFIGGVWFSFTRGIDTLMTLKVPVEYTNRDPGTEIVDTSVNSVQVHLSGSATLIKSLRPEDVDIRLDLGKSKVGTNTFNISREAVSLPPGVVLRDVEPSAVEVTLDVPLTKELPVQVTWSGVLSKKLILTEVKVDPGMLRVVGGKRVLKDISTVYTEKIPLDTIEESGSVTVRPVLDPPSLRLAPGSREKITVHYRVTKRDRERSS